LPDQVSLDSEAILAIQNALSSITTTDISEGDNLYFTEARAINAVEGLFDLEGSAASALLEAKSDSTAKVNAAQLAAAIDATDKVAAALITARADAEEFTTSSINSLTTSDIEEGTRLYFTESRVDEIVDPLITQTRSYVDQEVSDVITYVNTALESFDPGSSINSTSDLAEGSNLYFTNARAISATNNARTAVLVSALTAVDDLRTEINTSLTNYIPISDRNSSGGVAGLDSNSQVLESVIPSTIARSSDLISAIEGVIDSAPTAFDTLKEISDYIEADGAAAAALATLVDTKLASSLAETTYSPIDSPTFAGVVTIPAGALISGYATSIDVSDAIVSANDYTDLAIEGIENSLGGYQPESERNQNSGYAGLDSSGKILTSAVPVISNTMLENKSITINGSAVELGGTVITGYTNGISGSNINKITYGTNLTPPSSGNSAGDIYIQY
jgi:hypothetical protein